MTIIKFKNKICLVICDIVFLSNYNRYTNYKIVMLGKKKIAIYYDSLYDCFEFSSCSAKHILDDAKNEKAQIKFY